MGSHNPFQMDIGNNEIFNTSAHSAGDDWLAEIVKDTAPQTKPNYNLNLNSAAYLI